MNNTMVLDEMVVENDREAIEVIEGEMKPDQPQLDQCQWKDRLPHSLVKYHHKSCLRGGQLNIGAKRKAYWNEQQIADHV